MAELKKVLSFPAILLITINSIMGTGIFFLPAIGAGHGGPASIISWLLLSIISIYIAMCFAELSSMFPKSGGIYEFCKHAYGRLPSFLIGWTTIIAGNVTIAMLVVGAIQYLSPAAPTLFKIGASLIFIFVFNFIAFKGMQTSAMMLITFAFITLGSIFAVSIPGLFKFNFSNFSPFFVFGGSAIFTTIFVIAETFFGWETTTFLAEETKDGQKVMPKALILGTVIIAFICLFLVITSLGTIPWQTFGNSAAPLADLGVEHYGPQSRGIFTIWVYLAIIGSVAGWIVSAPRLLLAMAKDKLFLTQFAAIHKKNHTPHKAIIFQTVLSTILVIVGAGSYETLLSLLVPLVLILYSFVLFSLTIFRFTLPNQKRYFKVPFGKIGPSIIVIFLISLVGGWLWETHNAWNVLKLGLSFILLGIPIYFLLEMYYNEKAIRKVNSHFALIGILFEWLIHPKGYINKLFSLLGPVRNKKVLEYGFTVGTLTKKLSKKVLGGKIYAFDSTEHNVNIGKRRLKKHKNIVVHHHKSLNHFEIKQKIPKVHVIISSGALSYAQNPQRVLHGLSKRLLKGGKIVFAEYDNFFHIIPNVPWLSDDKRLKQMFTRAGFEIIIERKRGILWGYVFISGRKK
jgi:amino acid transporter